MEKFTSIEWLKIDIANAYGMDKLLFKDRLSWFKKERTNLSKLTPEEPCRAYAGLKALEKAERNEPIGYMVGLDATSSFAQMQGILLSDVKACLLSNVIFEDERKDIYTYLYKKVLEKVPNCPSHITRSEIKKVIMQYFYGGQKTPKEVLGEDIFEKFEEVMREELPLCCFLREYMLNSWDPTASEYTWVLPDNFHVCVNVEASMKESFTFKGKSFNSYYKVKAPAKTGRSLGPNFIHSVDGFILREMVARCHFDQNKIDSLRKVQYSKPKVINLNENTLKNYKTINILLDLGKKSGYYSIRLLDFIDESTYSLVPKDILESLLKSLPAKSFDISTIHDCFFCHPNYVNDMREQYRQCLISLAKSNLIEFCFKDLFKNPNFTFIKQDISEYVAQEEYAIC